MLVAVVLVVAPVLALVTIAVMTLPTVTPLALAGCHVVLAIVSVLALLQLRRLHPHRPA